MQCFEFSSGEYLRGRRLRRVPGNVSDIHQSDSKYTAKRRISFAPVYGSIRQISEIYATYPMADAPLPVPGKDYPRTWSQFLDWFGQEDACVAYIEKLRWPRGFVCPTCAVTGSPYRSSRGRLMCAACGHQTTVTAGTIFDKTRTPLRVWLAAAWYMTNQKLGVSALGLQRVLGLKCYQTAWAMLHRYRRAMVRPTRGKLKGFVEVDEAYLAITDRENPAPKGKSRTNMALVIVAVEILSPRGFGRIRLRRIPDDKSRTVIPFVQDNIEIGSRIRTDGLMSYFRLKKLGYRHVRKVHIGSSTPPHVSMPGVHRVCSLLKRWMTGTHHGSVQPRHLDAYLDEFVFRFNRRSSKSRGLLFYRLLEQAVATDPMTYNDVVDDVG
jgi:hypothetical protein